MNFYRILCFWVALASSAISSGGETCGPNLGTHGLFTFSATWLHRPALSVFSPLSEGTAAGLCKHCGGGVGSVQGSWVKWPATQFEQGKVDLGIRLTELVHSPEVTVTCPRDCAGGSSCLSGNDFRKPKRHGLNLEIPCLHPSHLPSASEDHRHLLGSVLLTFLQPHPVCPSFCG